MTVPFLPDRLDQNARVKILVNGEEVGTRRALNLLLGAESAVSEDALEERIDIDLDAAGSSLLLGGVTALTHEEVVALAEELLVRVLRLEAVCRGVLDVHPSMFPAELAD